jgi:hypothetical protein
MHLHLGLPSGLLPFGFSINILYAILFSPIRAICHAHLILLYLDKSTCYEVPHYVVFFQPPVTSSLFGPYILLNTLFSSHPHKLPHTTLKSGTSSIFIWGLRTSRGVSLEEFCSWEIWYYLWLGSEVVPTLAKQWLLSNLTHTHAICGC